MKKCLLVVRQELNQKTTDILTKPDCKNHNRFLLAEKSRVSAIIRHHEKVWVENSCDNGLRNCTYRNVQLRFFNRIFTLIEHSPKHSNRTITEQTVQLESSHPLDSSA